MATTHGILNPRAGEARFTLERHPPASDLAAFVERYWLVRWDLRGAPPFAQETLPHPNVNLVIGTHRPGVHGVGTERFVAALSGLGWVVGVKFRPGGFHPFFRRDVSELTGREMPLLEAFGQDGATLERDVLGAPDDGGRIERLERFLRGRNPDLDDRMLLVSLAVDLARADPTLLRTSELARRLDVSTRTLERLFRRYVGVPPKWVLRRFRVHEACVRIASGIPACWSTFAQELAYFDQAHFIRDFKAQVGRTPSEYAAECLAAVPRPA